MIQTVIIRPIIISSPTSMPEAKSRPMETSPTVPYRMMPTPGGMVAVMRAVQLMTFAVYPFEYPRSIMSGPSTRASIEASAMAEPETPPMQVERTTLTCASPPCI